MTPLEQEVADRIYAGIQAYTTTDARGAQAGRYEVGISDLGYCSERTKRMLKQEDPGDTDMTAAFIGTALGDHVERAMALVYPEALFQETVHLSLSGDVRNYTIPGHPDAILPWGILDVKTARGLSVAQRTGADQQKQFQRHGYAKAAHDAGYFNLPLEEVLVGNVWIDRAGDDKRPHVQLQRFDPTVLVDMTHWLDEVVDAFLSDRDAEKEPPREVCAATCGFFGPCRAFDTDVEGLLTDDKVLAAMEQYREALTMASDAARLKDQAKAHLAGYDGFALLGEDGERWSLRWTHVNGGPTPPGYRNSYDKIDIRKVK